MFVEDTNGNIHQGNRSMQKCVCVHACKVKGLHVCVSGCMCMLACVHPYLHVCFCFRWFTTLYTVARNMQ